jgi:hypothetical protein
MLSRELAVILMDRTVSLVIAQAMITHIAVLPPTTVFRSISVMMVPAAKLRVFAFRNQNLIAIALQAALPVVRLVFGQMVNASVIARSTPVNLRAHSLNAIGITNSVCRPVAQATAIPLQTMKLIVLITVIVRLKMAAVVQEPVEPHRTLWRSLRL